MGTGGATIQLTRASEQNFKRQMEKLHERTDEAAQFGFSRFLQNAVTLAKNKLKVDHHVKTGRLRNSIGWMTAKKNIGKYKDKNGKSYNGSLSVSLGDNEAAIGTNVEYASRIELMYDSFLYWAVKNSDVDEMGREISKRLLGIKQ